ncbi:MAG: TolC family protein [Marinilabiliales bacterium]|nr:TolC family protein [Marinilabiliales bacterium]
MKEQVTQAFYYVYQQQQSLDIAKQAYENMQKSYEVIKNKVDAGISAREEMFQAELNLATTKSDYENKQVALENAKDDFKLLIGMSLYDDIIVLAKYCSRYCSGRHRICHRPGTCKQDGTQAA